MKKQRELNLKMLKNKTVIKAHESKNKLLLTILSILLVSVIIAIVFLASVPPVSKDALTHHLAIPKLYLQHGKMMEFPDLHFSYFPMNVDLLYLIPLALGNDIIPKYIHFAFALGTCFFIFSYLNKRLGCNYGILGALFFLTTPIIVKLSSTAYVDLGMIFFSTASLLLLFEWAENDHKLKYLIGSAVFCGLATGTKYVGLVLLLIMAFLIPLIYTWSTKKNPRTLKAFGYTIIFISFVIFFFSPWLIRNYLWTNNPIYPLYNSLFNPGADSVTASMKPLLSRKLLYQESIWQIIALPVRVFFQGEDGSHRFFDGKMSPFLLLLPLYAAMFSSNLRKTGYEKKCILLFICSFFTIVFFTSGMRIRYISPIIPFLSILSVFTVYSIANKNSTIYRKTVAFLISSTFLIFNTAYLYDEFKLIEPFQYITGKVTREEFITKFRPEYPAIRYANKELPYNSKILTIFLGQRGYYFDRNIVFDYQKGKSKLYQILLSSRTVENIKDELRILGITHFIIRLDLFNEWIYKKLPHEKRNLFQLFITNKMILKYKDNNHIILKLKN